MHSKLADYFKWEAVEEVTIVDVDFAKVEVLKQVTVNIADQPDQQGHLHEHELLYTNPCQHWPIKSI